MIYNQWYPVLDSGELKKGKLLKIKRFNENMALWRNDENAICCISDKCCHRGASLSCGRITGGNLECPFHGFVFDKTGNVKVIPANGKNRPVPESMKVQAWQTFEGNGFIWVWWGDEEKATPEPYFFDDLKDFSYSWLKDHWNVHYSRAIENQLDVVHLPFIHRTTIGRGNKTLVHGPVVIRKDELLSFYVRNVADDGNTIPLRQDEITDYQKLPHLSFRYPNIWQNYISEKIRAFAAFVPVDEENTIIYIRYYQDLIRIPGLRWLFNYIGKISSIIILRQDKRIVITQLPKKSSVRMDERLIMGDKPIIEYRKHRQELIEMNGET
ncbi:MAG: aromatic ring-hydroxylating dioxygenase subunit alpha [Bacteroidales bacterium]|nr:aromatic ring-hydroxylating dioxygenase subunit alpha [Bacteroidales bacterium]